MENNNAPSKAYQNFWINKFHKLKRDAQQVEE